MPENIPVERGYAVTDRSGMLEIQRIDEMNKFESDAQAVRQALRDGVKLIQTDELPTNFPYRWFGWIDTPENRAAIQKYAETTALEDVSILPVNEYGLIVTPAVAAYLSLYKDLSDNKTWPDVENLIKSGEFDTAAKLLVPDLAKIGYFDFDLVGDILEELDMEHLCKYVHNFSGTATFQSGKTDTMNSRSIILITLDERDEAPDPVEQCRAIFKDILPLSFDYEDAIGTIKGTALQIN